MAFLFFGLFSRVPALVFEVGRIYNRYTYCGGYYDECSF
nr:MAG TPA: hypothetical protein [Caudoviricetes sp.]